MDKWNYWTPIGHVKFGQIGTACPSKPLLVQAVPDWLTKIQNSSGEGKVTDSASWAKHASNFGGFEALGQMLGLGMAQSDASRGSPGEPRLFASLCDYGLKLIP